MMAAVIATGVSFSRFTTIYINSDQALIGKPIFTYQYISATLNGEAIGNIGSGITVSDILPGDELILNFNILNFQGTEPNVEINDVKMKYQVLAVFNPPSTVLPLSYTLQPAEAYPSAGGGWTFLGFGTQETHSYTLTVNWDEEEDDETYQNKQQTIQIQLEAEQAPMS